VQVNSAHLIRSLVGCTHTHPVYDCMLCICLLLVLVCIIKQGYASWFCGQPSRAVAALQRLVTARSHVHFNSQRCCMTADVCGEMDDALLPTPCRVFLHVHVSCSCRALDVCCPCSGCSGYVCKPTLIPRCVWVVGGMLTTVDNTCSSDCYTPSGSCAYVYYCSHKYSIGVFFSFFASRGW
jgi:hypothetical protein